MDLPPLASGIGVAVVTTSRSVDKVAAETDELDVFVCPGVGERAHLKARSDRTFLSVRNVHRLHARLLLRCYMCNNGKCGADTVKLFHQNSFDAQHSQLSGVERVWGRARRLKLEVMPRPYFE